MGVVLYFLLRLEPFTTQALALQGGRFDHADRTVLAQAFDVVSGGVGGVGLLPCACGGMVIVAVCLTKAGDVLLPSPSCLQDPIRFFPVAQTFGQDRKGAQGGGCRFW